MSGADAVLLVLAGIGAGLTGSIAGLASLVSYPALLATGLSPLAANVTNTTSMLSNAVGAALGSRRELRGQWPRLRVLDAAVRPSAARSGAALLLTTDESTFEAVVPWLVGARRGPAARPRPAARLVAAAPYRHGAGLAPRGAVTCW